MRKLATLALLALVIVASGARAENIVVPGERVGFPTPPYWQLVAAGVDFNDDFVYIWVEAEGNCRWEYRQECHTGQNGQVVCHTIREWKCDRDQAYYKLPPTVTVDEGAKRAYYTAQGSQPLAFGKVKQFLWSKWIGLFDGAHVNATHQTAELVMDPDALAGSLQKDNFQQLYSTRVD